MGVSKTDFVRGLQCPKMLWLDSHRPEEKIIPEEVQIKLDEGNAFGDRAMNIFGAYVETTCYRADGRLDYKRMLEKTSECLKDGTPVICEAAFSWYGNYCAADILKKTATGYELYEVKNAPAVRKEFLIDLGFQSFLLKKCGVAIEKCCLILRGEREGEYRIEDETDAARALERTADRKIWTFARLKKQSEEPCVSVGEQCDEPYRCWYYEYCHGEKR